MLENADEVADTRDVADLPSLCLPVRESLGERETERDVVTDGVSLRDSVPREL